MCHRQFTPEWRTLLRMLVVGLAISFVWQLFAVRPARAADDTPQDEPPQNVNATPRIAPGLTPTVRYYHHDVGGNVVATTDASGSVTWRATMQPFGQGEGGSPSGAEDRPLRFVGQPMEDIGGESGGLYQLGARFMDPLVGRFLGIDPLAITDVPVEEPQRFNRYAYGLNNPYRYVDTSGANPEDARKVLLELAEKMPDSYADPAIKGSNTPVRELTEKLAKLPANKNALIVEGAKVARVTPEGFAHWLRNAWAQGYLKTLRSAPRPTTRVTLPGFLGVGVTLALSAPTIAEAAETTSEGRYGSTLSIAYDTLRGSVAIANPMEWELWTNKLSYSLTASLYGLFGLEEYLPPRQKTLWEQNNERAEEIFNSIDRWLAED